MRQQRELLAVEGMTGHQSHDSSEEFFSGQGPEQPQYPVFPLRPTDEEMARLVKIAYDRTMEAFHEEMAAAKKRAAAESQRGKRGSVGSLAKRV